MSSRNDLASNMPAVSDFLKFGFESHVGTDSDCLHDIRYAVIWGANVCVHSSLASKFAYFLAPFELISRIQTSISTPSEPLHTVSDY